MKMFLMATGVLCITAIGCDSKTTSTPPTKPSTESLSIDGPPPPTVEVHAHAAEGPHHGTLIELGKEEFHAELVHDEKAVTVYILDSSAKTLVPIESKEITINLLHNSQPKQFKLAATPAETDPSGKSSTFILIDPDLIAGIESESSSPKLNVVIEGKPYRGTITHEHSSHGHAHDH